MTKKAALFVFWLTFAVGYNYLYLVFGPAASKFLVLHQGIIDHTANSPYVYRMLVPELVRAGSAVLKIAVHNAHNANVAAYAIFTLSAIAFSLSSLYLLLRSEFSELVSLCGVVLIGLSMMISFQENQPWSLLDPGIYALGMLWRRSGHLWRIVPLIAIATLNRETALFLVLMLALVAYGREANRRNLVWSLAYLTIWAAVYGFVRIHIGSRPHEDPVSHYIALNLKPVSLVNTALKAFLFLGPFWILVRRGLRVAPVQLRHALLAFPLFLVVAAPWALWWEVRLWTPYYCVLIPLLLYGLRDLLSKQQPALRDRLYGSPALVSADARHNAMYASEAVPQAEQVR